MGRTMLPLSAAASVICWKILFPCGPGLSTSSRADADADTLPLALRVALALATAALATSD